MDVHGHVMLEDPSYCVFLGKGTISNHNLNSSLVFPFTFPEKYSQSTPLQTHLFYVLLSLILLWKCNAGCLDMAVFVHTACQHSTFWTLGLKTKILDRNGVPFTTALNSGQKKCGSQTMLNLEQCIPTATQILQIFQRPGSNKKLCLCH